MKVSNSLYPLEVLLLLTTFFFSNINSLLAFSFLFIPLSRNTLWKSGSTRVFNRSVLPKDLNLLPACGEAIILQLIPIKTLQWVNNFKVCIQGTHKFYKRNKIYVILIAHCTILTIITWMIFPIGTITIGGPATLQCIQLQKGVSWNQEMWYIFAF